MAHPAGLRFSEITPHDHQAWLWNLSLMSLAFSFLTLGMRMIVKVRMYGVDDLALGIAYALALGHWTTLFAALKEGVGRDGTLVSSSALREASKLVSISQILLFLSLGFSKCTVLLFIRNLFTRDTVETRRICNVMSALAVGWGVASALIVSIDCPISEHLLNEPASCTAESARWKAVVAVDVVLEFMIAGLAVYLFAGLHMRLDRKITVISAFFFRLPTAAVFIVVLTTQLHYLSIAHTGSADTSVAIVKPLICLEALICYALLSATIPCLRGFLGRFRTGDLIHVDGSTGHYGYGRSGDRAAGHSMQLKSFKSLKGSQRESQARSDERALFQRGNYGHNAGGVEHSATAAATFDGSRLDTSEENRSMQSIGSEEMIIHRQTVVEVTRN